MHQDAQPIENETVPAVGAYLLPYPLQTLSRPIPLASSRTTVGRSPKNSFVIDAPTISRYHAVVISRDGNYYLKDLDSRNGTFVNGQPNRVGRIGHHDRIAFGNRQFIFLVAADRHRPEAGTPLVAADESLALSGDALDPIHILACEAEQARKALFPPQGGAPAPEPSGTEAKKPTLLQRLGGHRTDDPLEAAAERQSRLISDMHRDHERLALLYRLSERIRAASRPATIMDEGLELVMRALPTAAKALILLRSGRGGALKTAAGRDRDPETGDSSVRISQTLLEWVLTEKMALMTTDASADSRLKDAESIRMSQRNAIICVPMLVSRRVVGVIYVDFEDLFAPITEADVAFIAAVGHELAMSIVNAQLQRSLIRSERMAAIGLTVSNLAHNIKNLTMMNQNALELMRIHLDRIQDGKADRCWQILEKGFNHTSTLSMEMLAYVREERLAPVTSDINALIRANADLFKQHLAVKGGKLILALDGRMPDWSVDPKQFQRALVNVVINAVDAIGDKSDGRVRIATRLDKDGRLVVAVTDNGCGIPADKRQRIFDLFFTTKGTGGSGLGLPMVNKFLRASGGRLTVASKPGIGTRFQMILPPGRQTSSPPGRIAG